MLKPFHVFPLTSKASLPKPLSTDLYVYCSSSGFDSRNHFFNSCDFRWIEGVR